MAARRLLAALLCCGVVGCGVAINDVADEAGRGVAYYYDLGKDAVGTGTITDPASQPQFIADAVGGFPGNPVHVHGRTTEEVIFGDDAGIEITGWDGSSDDLNQAYGLLGGIDMSAVTAPPNIKCAIITQKFLEINGDGPFIGRSCYVEGSAYIITSAVTNVRHFYGCTFKTNALYCTFPVGSNPTFEQCYFDCQQIIVTDCTVTFKKCWFVGTEQEIRDAISYWSGSVTFVDCRFTVALKRDLPAAATVAPANLRYSLYGLPKLADPDWSSLGIDDGLDDSDRQGPGAFYFAPLVPDIAASPEHGHWPLSVEFDANADESVESAAWDFGDGEDSDEITPAHIYQMPGTYTAVVTFTDALGNETTDSVTIYVYDWDYSGTGLHVSLTDKLFRQAVTPGQGVAMAEWGGYHPQPAGYVGCVQGHNDNKESVALTFDNRDGEFYRWGVADTWRDKISDYGSYPIATRWLHKENVSQGGENQELHHIENHVHLREWHKDYRGASGFDERGFLEGFLVGEKLYVDGEAVSPEAVIRDVPIIGDHVFREDAAGNRMQLEVNTTESGYRCVAVEQMLESIDKAVGPGDDWPSENRWQLSLANVDLFLGRGVRRPLLNRATGAVLAGSYDTLVTGPDGKDRSGVGMLTTNSVAATLAQTAGDSSLLVWLADLGGTQVRLLRAVDDEGDNLEVRVRWNGGAMDLELLCNGVVFADQGLNWSGAGWMHLALVRDGANLRVYENGVSRGMLGGDALETYGGSVTLFGDSLVSHYGLRRVLEAVSAKALVYYYDDVVNHAGITSEPVMG